MREPSVSLCAPTLFRQQGRLTTMNLVGSVVTSRSVADPDGSGEDMSS
jgi:hypothetical protein